MSDHVPYYIKSHTTPQSWLGIKVREFKEPKFHIGTTLELALIRDGADPIQYRYRDRYQRNSRIGFFRSNLRRNPIFMIHVCALTLAAEMTPKGIPRGC